MTGFFAHSTKDSTRADWQGLADHLEGVARLAADFASIFGAQDMARVQGLLHDLGKYTAAFQERLAGSELRVDHSTWGARVAIEKYPGLGQLLAYGIAGHHAGLANGQGEGERTNLQDRLAAELPELLDAWKEEISLPKDLGALPTRLRDKASKHFQLAFLVRMVFSCLVDADFIDTERFYLQHEGGQNFRQDGAAAPSLEALRQELDHHLSGFAANTDVKRLRGEILAHVRGQASQPPGLFSLTVPTGGGKTLASLAFALDHAIQHRLRRVIFVIPFTSIVEQNAAVFRDALGALGDQAVLEHHSAFVQAEPPRNDAERYQAAKKLQLAMENWDMPIVVTTAVQFFESLFAAKPSQCRKLHNIAGSVVILDEAQTMPLKLLQPCVAALDELARNYRTSVVLCTATQPALREQEFTGGFREVHELAPEPVKLFKQLERVRVRHVGVWTDDELTAQMWERAQVLCIVNNRRHARSIYQSMDDLPGARHLTTFMCAQHRREVLDEVRELLKAESPCRLVSTSLIEAGVDIDFPTVLRAEAGLDSLAQAAGRCNREGLHAAQCSEVLVFVNANPDWTPPKELVPNANTAREVLRAFQEDPLSPAAINEYFRQLYWHKGPEKLDEPGLMQLLRASRLDSLPMETLASKFKLIDQVYKPVIIPYDEKARAALDALRHASGCGGLARKLQPYVVQLPQKGFDALHKAGAIAAVAPDKWGTQFMELVHVGLYDRRYGINLDEPSLIGVDHLQW